MANENKGCSVYTKDYIKHIFAPAIKKESHYGKEIVINDASRRNHMIECKVESENVVNISDRNTEDIHYIIEEFEELNKDIYTVSFSSPSIFTKWIEWWHEGIRKGATNFTSINNRIISTMTVPYALDKILIVADKDHTQINDIKIQKGSIATHYTPYISDLSTVYVTQTIGDKTKTLHADKNGVIKGFMSGPDMSFKVDTPGALLSVKYNIDIEDYLDQELLKLTALSLEA